MKLRLFFSTAFLMVGLSGFAQEPIRYGLKAGVNLANYDAKLSIVDLNTKSLPSFYVTAYADIPFANPSFSIQPGLSFQGKGGKLEGSFQRNTTDDPVSGTVSERPYWLEIPVNVIGRTAIGRGSSFFVGAGPYVAFGVGGDYKFKTSTGLGLVDWLSGSLGGDLKYGSNGHLKSVDFGLNFLAGFELSGGFSVQAGYGLGLTDIGGRKLGLPFEQQNRVLSFGIGKAF